MYPRPLFRRLTASPAPANSSGEQSLQTRYGVSALLLLVFVGVLHARLPRPPAVTPRLIALDALPRVLSGWRNEADNPATPRLQWLLPGARLLRRAYQDGQGNAVDLLLVSSRSERDYHTPQYCLSAENWQITASASVKIGNEEATELEIHSGGRQALMLYWYQYERAAGAWDRRAAPWMSERAPMPLFVRMVVPLGSHPAAARQALRGFAQAAQPSLQALLASP